MKFSIAALGLMLFCFIPAQAQDSSDETTGKEARAAAQANDCVVSGKSWRECLGLPPSYSITDSSPYDPPIVRPEDVLVKRERFKFRGPWAKTAVDYMADPYFGQPGRYPRR